MSFRNVAAVLAVVLAGCGEHRVKYPTAESPLGLDRVVLYRNGVGYFERTGKLDGDVLTLKVRKDQVDDLLKSLTVIERSTGRAVSISMPLDPQSWANAALSTLRPGQGGLAQVLDSLRGSLVTLDTEDGDVTGRIAMVEPFETAGGKGGDDDDDDGPARPKMDYRVSLLDGDEFRVVLLSRVTGVRLEDGDLALQFNRTLDASAGEGMFQQVEVSIRLAGAKHYDLLVSYVVQAPMWKPTYRVVLPKDGGKGKALLQAWAVVDNTSGEEWRDVNLALTSGAPIAFRYDLHTPRDVPRPDLTETGVHAQAQAYVGETTYDGIPSVTQPMPAPAAPVASTEYEKNMPATKTRASAGAASSSHRDAKADYYDDGEGGEFGGYTNEESDMPSMQQGIDFDSLRRSTQAQAKAATAAGQTRFELGERVTVPAGTSTMVAIVNADVDGEETFLYKPGGAGMGYESNPYRVVRFKNSTPFVLEPGPIGIYAGGSFVGEGLSETVGAGTSATVPFAVETGIMVTSSYEDNRDDMRLLKLSRGVLEVEQFARRVTTYSVKAQTIDTGYTVVVRHPKAGWNYELAPRPEGTEDLPDAYMVKVTVAAGKREGELKVTEQTPSRTQLSIWNEPALPLLEKLIVDTNLDAETRKKLKPIVEDRRTIGKYEEQISGLTDKRDKLDQRAQELRQNILAIAKNPAAGAQRTKWTKQLDEFTSEGNKIGAQLADLEAKRLDARVELENLIGDLEIVVPSK